MAAFRAPIYFINLLPTSLLYISILLADLALDVRYLQFPSLPYVEYWYLPHLVDHWFLHLQNYMLMHQVDGRQ